MLEASFETIPNTDRNIPAFSSYKSKPSNKVEKSYKKYMLKISHSHNGIAYPLHMFWT